MRQRPSSRLSERLTNAVLALVLTRFLSGLLFDIGATDPLTYMVVPLVLMAVAVAACYLPVRHVSRLNPLDALRRE